MPSRIPDVTKCCICVTDLKTAVSIIAVLGIVTSPAVSWALVRHAYVIRVSCVMSTSNTRPDVIDINFRNVLSFGLGANAGFGTSCLKSNSTQHSPEPVENVPTDETEGNTSGRARYIKYLGWIVLVADLIFLVTCVVMLVKIFKGTDGHVLKVFLYSAMASAGLTFLYGLYYTFVCISTGSGFPMFELFFTFFDFIVWAYFIIVIKSYRNQSGSAGAVA